MLAFFSSVHFIKETSRLRCVLLAGARLTAELPTQRCY